MNSLTIALLGVAAICTAAMSAVLGMAGGVTLLGIMTVFMIPADVVPVHGIVQLSSNVSRTALLLRHVRWSLFGLYAGPFIVGIALATWVWSGDRLSWFQPAIGGFLLAFLVYRRHSPRLKNPPRWVYPLVGLGAGFLAIFVGATGPITSAFFFRDDFDKEEIIATLAACQSFGHLTKIPAFLALGFEFGRYAPLLAAMIVASFVGTYLGRRVLHRIPQQVFIVLFEGVLGLMGVYLIGKHLLS